MANDKRKIYLVQRYGVVIGYVYNRGVVNYGGASSWSYHDTWTGVLCNGKEVAHGWTKQACKKNMRIHVKKYGRSGIVYKYEAENECNEIDWKKYEDELTGDKV
jgi:hypothetical protein